MTAENRQSGLRAVNRSIADICAALAANKRVRQDLPFGGRIHVDHLEPFLCVYRQPPARDDAGTSELLNGQASYLVLPGEAVCRAAGTRLIKGLVAVLSEAFGAAILVEVWTSDKGWNLSHESSEFETRRGFRILAPKNDPPVETLDALKHGLAAADWGVDYPDIGIEYGRRVARKSVV